MKFSIYGVSRSGKDYFISKLESYFSERDIHLHHISGSETLKKFSIERFNIEFQRCNEVQKNELRELFIDYVKNQEFKFEYIVVDGHYAFYNKEGEFNTVCTKNDLDCYDKFFYLDTKSDCIIERMRNSFEDKRNNEITQEQVQIWQNYEIENLTQELLNIDKELHILTDTTNIALEYVFDCVVYDRFNSKRIAQDMIEGINFDTDTIILVDCDRTLSIEDSSALAYDYIQRPKTELKELFKNDRYSNFQSYQFFKLSENINLFNDCSNDFIIKNIFANKYLIDLLKSIKNATVIGITAGNGQLWNRIIKRFGLNINILSHTETIVSKFVKYYAVKELQKSGKYVIAIGDSMLDSLMLKQANKSYIVTQKGYRDIIANLLASTDNIIQLSEAQCYINVKHEKTITAIKTLPINDDKVYKNISICKSNSGICGTPLREAHYNLGKEIAKMIKTDFPNDKFTVVAIMRSGVPYSMGIADYLDCSIVFYDSDNFLSFDKQLNENLELKNTTFILCDAVINSGRTINCIIEKLKDRKCIVATNVLCDKYDVLSNILPIYASRISSNSYIGAKQNEISNGKGPDTADRLFNLISF